MESGPSKSLDDGHLFSSPPTAETLDDVALPSPPPLSHQETLDDVTLPSSPLRPQAQTLDTDSSVLVNASGDASPSSLPNSFADIGPLSPKRPFAYSDPSYSLSSYGEVSMMGAGLENLGNTCFLNAILQCFTHTVPLVQGLRSCNHATPCERGSKEFCVLCALRDHVELSLASSGRIISPSKLVDNLSYLSSSFRRFEQEDAHEFLQCLLDRLDSCCLDPTLQNQNLSSQEVTFVKQIFGGRLKSQLRCCNCSHRSDTFEPLIDLSLEIDDVDTLPNALQSFTKVENIEDPETRFTCENCKQKVSVEKQLTLDQAPLVAAFHLKRFKNDGSYVEKIDKHVEYPLELDLHPYTGCDQKNNVNLKYELYAVVVHIGFTPWSGHYYCFIRSSPHTWHRLDDSKVMRVTQEFVLAQEAYILFYARHGSPWFSSLMETLKPCMNTNSPSTSPKSVLDVERVCIPLPLKENSCREANGARDDVGKVSNTLPPGASSFTVFDAANDDEERKSYPCQDHNCCSKPEESRNNVGVCPQTPPPRSPSPDIYSDGPSEKSYSIPRAHLRSEERLPCTRPGNNALEEFKKKQLVKLTKTMPSSRRNGLMAALQTSRSDGSLDRKRRRTVSRWEDHRDRDANRTTYRKLSPQSITRAVTAGDFR
uniref:Ubiquitin carboxyl-terminal hydrolase n=1 Tax=Nelumbo nucifera TaxID=4432 RepID=A0A822Y344_NELNU|nr:TPA_asm: hypothetical protein HUJ06_025511 [Nelumbo nucifera]